MGKRDFSAESPMNYEQKCLCVLTLDVSGSMAGKAIDELNQGLQNFYDEIKQDVVTANRLEISIITFNDKIECVLEPALIANFTMPILKAGGSTKLVDGVQEAIAKVHARKAWYKQTGQPYYRPWIILMTDGEPDTDQDIPGLAKEIHIATDNGNSQTGKKYVFYAIGVEDANMKMLSLISNPKMPPAKMQGLKFSAFFKWLSASMSSVTSSKDGQLTTADLADPHDWMKV